MAETRLIYFGDPMCSWCYGFLPVIGALADQFEGRLPVEVIMGGLRAANTQPMRPKDKDYIRETWTQVEATTGQPFDMSFLDRESFTYDTEPACRAVVTARRMLPHMALPFMARIQQAFYAENRDITSASEIADIADEAGFHRAEFSSAFASPEVQNETFRDFLIAQELGIRGFPTLIGGSEDKGYALVTNGYRPLEDLAEPLEHWLEAGAPVTKEQSPQLH